MTKPVVKTWTATDSADLSPAIIEIEVSDCVAIKDQSDLIIISDRKQLNELIAALTAAGEQAWGRNIVAGRSSPAKSQTM